jgi:hypothetical protein
MAGEWYYFKGGETIGPVSAVDLKNLAERGEIEPTDLVWRDDMPEWRPADTIGKLFSKRKRNAAGSTKVTWRPTTKPPSVIPPPINLSVPPPENKPPMPPLVVKPFVITASNAAAPSAPPKFSTTIDRSPAKLRSANKRLEFEHEEVEVIDVEIIDDVEPSSLSRKQRFQYPSPAFFGDHARRVTGADQRRDQVLHDVKQVVEVGAANRQTAN